MRSDNLLFRSMLMLILALAMGGCGDSGNSNAALAPKALLSIAVTPSAHSLSTGQTQQFSATGTFSDARPRISLLRPHGHPQMRLWQQ
ncbi:Ig-like domain-containing protein [Geotalea toluenoxydans]|uniref:Ig-like domain-containing protein n=1 Tax=Geotalea toluenoxydans TaxID=421624 RepID=UPI000B2EFB64|nr:Ig-like domain-containing protein [Geotalea toluenoxydans]